VIVEVNTRRALDRSEREADLAEALVETDVTPVVAVAVGRGTGYWISGAPHEIVFVDPSGMPVFDSRRIVGDTLLWASGGITYRLETALDLATAVTLAESLH